MWARAWRQKITTRRQIFPSMRSSGYITGSFLVAITFSSVLQKVKMLRACVCVIFLFALYHSVVALPSGAPTSACSDMTQRHPGNSPQPCDSGCPFTLTLTEVDGAPVPVGKEGLYRCGAQHTSNRIVL